MDRLDRLQKRIDSLGAEHLLVHQNAYSEVASQLSCVDSYAVSVVTSDLRFTSGRLDDVPSRVDLVVYLCDSHEAQYFSYQQLSKYLSSTPVVVIGPRKSTKHLVKSLVVDSRFYSDDLLVAVLLPQALEFEVPTYSFSETIGGVSCVFVTQKGLFSYQQIDAGTRFLLEVVDVSSARRVLDFGCGYGAISCFTAKKNPSCELVGADSDLLAVRYAMKNLEANGLSDRVSVQSSFLLRGVSGKFDMVLCNPPTHTPTDQVKELFNSMRQVLVAGGAAYMVINQAVSYEPLLRELFSSVRVLATQGKYKIVCATR